MTDPESIESHFSPVEPISLSGIRLRVLERMLWIWAILGGLFVTIVCVDDVLHGRYVAALFYLLSYGFVLVCLRPRPLPYVWRGASPLVVLYLVGSWELYHHGLNSTGNLYYFAIVLFTSILFGGRAAVAVLTALLASLCVVSYQYILNANPVPLYDSIWAHVRIECLPDLISLAMLATMSIIFLSLLLQSLDTSVETSQRYLAEIARERNQLAHLISERKQAEEQLRQAQKMEAVGQLAGGIAHDFNNLLQVIGAQTEILLGQTDPASEHHDLLREVRSASERASALTRQLLAYSRQQIMAPVYLNLNSLIVELMKMLHRVIPENIDVRFEPADGLGTAHADPGQIEQVLVNLCLNARDAMTDGGVLTIRTDNMTADSVFRQARPWAEAGPYVVIEVSDTGIGMDAEVQKHIFEPFYTTKKLGEGTGLGLAMAYGIVKQHNGMIESESVPGSGTTFRVFLPVVRHDPVRHPVESVTPTPHGTETILIAEDDEAVRSLLIGVLKNAGFRVHAATDGEAAVDLFGEHQDAIDLLLFDVVMPRMGGREACEAIRETHPNTRVLFMSGYAPEGLSGPFDLGKDTGFIQKPYRIQELLDKVRATLDA